MTDARIPDHCAWAARGRWREAYNAAEAALRKVTAERDGYKCPLGMDQSQEPNLCSAGVCVDCIARQAKFQQARAEAAEAEVARLTAQAREDAMQLLATSGQAQDALTKVATLRAELDAARGQNTGDDREAAFDNDAVYQFSRFMRDKMTRSRAKGRSGWNDPAKCSPDYLRNLLYEHIYKGDPVDVANLCMMLRHYDEPTTPRPEDDLRLSSAARGRVKPLNWHDGDEPGELKSGPYDVWCELGKFQCYYWSIILGEPHGTADEAVAFLNEHHRARILAALAPDPAVVLMREALRPFAALAEQVDKWGHEDGSTCAHRIKACDIRRARAALKEE